MHSRSRTSTCTTQQLAAAASADVRRGLGFVGIKKCFHYSEERSCLIESRPATYVHSRTERGHWAGYCPQYDDHVRVAADHGVAGATLSSTPISRAEHLLP